MNCHGCFHCFLFAGVVILVFSAFGFNGDREMNFFKGKKVLLKSAKAENKVSVWLKSGEFNYDINSALTNIVRGAELSKSEAETANIFERELYYLIRCKLGIKLEFRKECPVSGVIHSFGELAKRKSGKGRLDAVINSVVIEYKHHSKLTTGTQRQQAVEQVRDYLMAMNANGMGECQAILTDGIVISYFAFANGIVQNTLLRQIAVDDVEMIIRAILSNGSKKFNGRNIAADFAVSGSSCSESRDLAKSLYLNVVDRPTAKTQMLYEEWKGLMHLSVDDNGKSGDIKKRRNDLSIIFDSEIVSADQEYKALFALQTTYAVIVKLIACKVVDYLNFNEETQEYHDLVGMTSEKMQRFLQKMEDGYSYSNMGIRNFLEGDFFSWYADENQWNRAVYLNIKKLIGKVDAYSAFSLNVKYDPVDVFKDLYMGIIPQSIRHSMGEYFTPEWLADCVIEKSLSIVSNKNGWRAIDPCCGSGIFIVSLIKRVVGDVRLIDLDKATRQMLLEDVLHRVHGIDINPLSVLSARVSYFLAIHQLGDVSNVEIPVYLGDSAIIPAIKVVDGIECYAYSVNNLKCKSFDIVLPKRFVSLRDFGKTMSKLQALVRTERPQVLKNVLFENLSESERGSKEILRHIDELSESLVELHRKKWDGIWIRIAMNFMMIARIRQFDLIVGNPPWVKWEHLPAAYTRKIKEFCDVRHIFCNDGGMYGGAQLNICALIANVTASNWLTGDGVLAFLMPDSIMSQNSYEEFRNFYVDYARGSRLYLQAIDRWMAPLRPFKVGDRSVSQDFNTYYYSSNTVNYARGVPVRTIGRRNGCTDAQVNACSSFSEACEYLDVGAGLARQLSPQSTAFTYVSEACDFSLIVGETAYLYRTGVESTPFEVFKLVGIGPSEHSHCYRFRNKVLKTSRYKVDDVPLNGWDFQTKYIYPMLEGPNVRPFVYDCGQNYHIVPYDRADTSKPISIEQMMDDSEDLALYFSNHRSVLEQQSDKSKAMHRGEEFYALSKIGPYTFAPALVAARDNSRFCATVVHPTRTPWGEVKQTICVKHTIIISQDVQGAFITEDEAHYINGVLNSSIVHDYIHATFKTNGFSLNKSKLFLPKYCPDEREFVALARISREATEDEGKRQLAPERLTAAYLRLCKRFNKSPCGKRQ